MTEYEPSSAPAEAPANVVSAKKTAALLAVIAVVVIGASLFGSLWEVTPAIPNAELPAPATTETTVIPQGTLGIELDALRERWNEVSTPPEIGRPLRRTPETGELDSFFHRFDGAANISGAYRDDNEFLVAIKVEVGLGHPDVSAIHVHLCHLVSPFSPQCLADFHSMGLENRAFEEVRDSGISTSWDFDGNQWRLDESDGVLSIRVIASS